MSALPAAEKSIAPVVFWMTGALFSFSVLAVSIRALASRLNVFEILSIRSASGTLILLSIALIRPELRSHLRPRLMWLHAVRNTAHFAAQVAWALAITLLPLAVVFSLEFTTPAWLTLMAVTILRERMTVSRAGTVLLGFLGVIVILRPGIEAFRPEALLVLAAAVGFATALTATKKLTATVSTFAILFWMNLMQLPMNLAGSDPLFLLRLDSHAILPVLGIVVCGISSHFCITNAFRAGDAIIVIPMDFMRIPLIALVGWTFYGESIDVFVFLGAVIIIAGILWNVRAEMQHG